MLFKEKIIKKVSEIEDAAELRRKQLRTERKMAEQEEGEKEQLKKLEEQKKRDEAQEAIYNANLAKREAAEKKERSDFIKFEASFLAA